MEMALATTRRTRGPSVATYPSVSLDRTLFLAMVFLGGGHRTLVGVLVDGKEQPPTGTGATSVRHQVPVHDETRRRRWRPRSSMRSGDRCCRGYNRNRSGRSRSRTQRRPWSRRRRRADWRCRGSGRRWPRVAGRRSRRPARRRHGRRGARSQREGRLLHHFCRRQSGAQR